MAKKLRVVQYLNQFFSGIGGEEKAGIGPQVLNGAIGLGQAIQKALGERGEIVATATCGDNYFGERLEQAANEIIELIRPYQPDIVIAGPAFEAGRYGVACGALCKAVKDKLNIPALTGMYEENPGVELYHKDVWIIQTGASVKGMGEVVTRIVNLAIKLTEEQKIGKPDEEGYFPHGIIVNEEAKQIGAERVIDMLLKKLQGKPFETEAVQPIHHSVVPALAIKNIRSAKIALVTDGGLGLRGNPDNIASSGALNFGIYSFEGVESLDPANYDVYAGGYDPALVNQNPNRLVPVDVLRDMENRKEIGKLHEKFYTTAGVAASTEQARKIGQAIAAALKAEGVTGVIHTSS